MHAKLELKLRQLHHALGQVRDADVGSLKVETFGAGPTRGVSLDARQGMSDAELANAVGLFIANIACLRDYLKAWCAKNGKPFEGDTLINSNKDVAIIHDLWNLDKHVELNKPSRSGLDPSLDEIHRSIRMTSGANAGSSMGMTLDPRTGALCFVGDGKADVVIDATVLDGAGTRIGGLVEIAERAIAAWEAALVKVGVTLPSP